jgi:putative tricarboxylic transport membrane protein
MAKGITAGALGAAFGMVGMDPMTAEGRFTFGSVSLLGGISFVAVMIGLFGVSEALHQIHTLHVKGVKQNVDKVLPSWAVILKFLPLTIRTSLIGVIVGALPGTGGDIASLMAYDHAKRTVKNPTKPFGKGAYEGLIAPESANNAAVGGAFIPMLTLGIPGDAVTAVIIGALYIHGLRPGPMLMVDTPHLFWFIVGALVLATIFMVIFGLTGIRVFAKVVEVKKGILNPVIIVLSVIGTYAINNSMTDVYWMLGFGLFGYLLKMYRFQVAPIVLGVILGPLMDLSYRRAVMSTENSLLKFLLELITNPLSCVLTVAVVFMLISQTALWASFLGMFKKKRTGEAVLEPEC